MGSKLSINIDDQLDGIFNEKLEKYIESNMETQFETIVKKVVEKKLKGKSLLAVVEEAIKNVLPIEKIKERHLEKKILKKEYIDKLVNEEIIRRIRAEIPTITVNLSKDLDKIFD